MDSTKKKITHGGYVTNRLSSTRNTTLYYEMDIFWSISDVPMLIRMHIGMFYASRTLWESTESNKHNL